MPRISLILFASLATLLGGCTSDGWHTYAAAPRTQQLASNDPNMICKDMAATGTRMIKRECHTQAEWDTLAEAEMQKLNQDAARSAAATGH
jgi:hypothetical protein